MKLVVSLCLALLAATAAAAPPALKAVRGTLYIDGHNLTIAEATSEQMDGVDIFFSFSDLVLSIVKALNEPEFDYWGNVKEEVEALVGAYINEHNMNQVEAFEQDLEKLLIRYLEAPVESDNYPDKNQQASTLSMAIISHRYLVMSGDLRHSLILHFEDIASMHIVVLKDAAETYSIEGSPSLWWVDLDNELGDYILYSRTVRQELEDWRMAMITCTEEINVCEMGREGRKVCYDIYTVIDAVTLQQSECKQLTQAMDCVNHCQAYVGERQQELDMFAADKVWSVTDAWERLKEVSEEMAAAASPYRDPAHQQ